MPLTARLALRPALPVALVPTLALVSTYARLPFGLGFRALAFTTAASGTYRVHWVAHRRRHGPRA